MSRQLEPIQHPIFSQFPTQQSKTEGDYRANFVGAKQNVAYLAENMLKLYDEGVDMPPFTEEYFEWVDVLESVKLARDRYIIAEIGAGFGRWIANAICALRLVSELPYTVVGVEADPQHFSWLVENMQANEITQDFRLHQVAVSDSQRYGDFHVFEDAAASYGQRLEPLPKNKSLRYVLGGIRRRLFNIKDPGVVYVKVVTLDVLLEGLPWVDLLDLDIQGAELGALKASFAALENVKRVHISTHGKARHSELQSLFTEAGWESNFDYPEDAVSTTPYGEIYFQDGRQSWINPRFPGPSGA